MENVIIPFLTSLLLTPLVVMNAETISSAPVLEIDFKAPATPVSPLLNGLMTEEVNHSYDGGLYAELVRNRVFRDVKENKPDFWSAILQPGAEGAIRVVTTHPLTDKLPNSLEVDIQAASAEQRFGVKNDGYWGIPVKPNTTYRASFYVKGDVSRKNPKTGEMDGITFTGPLRVSLESADGSKVYARAQTPTVSKTWQKFEVTLTAGTDANPSSDNRFVISSQDKGKFWLSLVSLFPPTYHDRPNGLRVDIMEKLAAMKPKFIRFPGGNYLEGDNLWERFDWKTTLGPLPFRAGHPGCWGYRSTDGMGLLEFMNWCEDLGAQPVLAVFAGYSMRQQPVEPGLLLEPYVREALGRSRISDRRRQDYLLGRATRQGRSPRTVPTQLRGNRQRGLF